MPNKTKVNLGMTIKPNLIARRTGTVRINGAISRGMTGETKGITGERGDITNRIDDETGMGIHLGEPEHGIDEGLGIAKRSLTGTRSLKGRRGLTGTPRVSGLLDLHE